MSTWKTCVPWSYSPLIPQGRGLALFSAAASPSPPALFLLALGVQPLYNIPAMTVDSPAFGLWAPRLQAIPHIPVFQVPGALKLC